MRSGEPVANRKARLGDVRGIGADRRAGMGVAFDAMAFPQNDLIPWRPEIVPAMGAGPNHPSLEREIVRVQHQPAGERTTLLEEVAHDFRHCHCVEDPVTHSLLVSFANQQGPIPSVMSEDSHGGPDRIELLVRETLQELQRRPSAREKSAG